MDNDEQSKTVKAVKGWLLEARDDVLRQIDSRLKVDTKSSRSDLVTNIDRSNEKFIVNKIREFDPDAKILGEEGFGDKVTDTKGRIWIVDPIDGTMNFVKQRNHFAMMLSLYINGQGVLGFIMDVMNNELVYGGPDLGVFINTRQMVTVNDSKLQDGLIGLSGPMVVHDDFNMQEIANTSLGMRVYGSAGIDMIAVLKGELVGYISYLKPWDFGAGRILAETIGLKITTIDGRQLGVLSSEPVLLATENAHHDILTIVKK
ncbi:inositol monophosphatase family protein [Lentilactobacillus sp. SPB1-3]|uniref:Inositol monophosphatase family protein n=1 Tax=Lentilactobacillus terminaliae TaxID=3003483 RepID=A0ACD5DD57_9LACO|nr:inositol monophosphatase family protein [Lentilactobacillus sp. SPB1-3]MCZ0977863.1 inositol monophosphatase family protein [Lentilactobacillus sp. SPB1-3]